MLVFEQIPVEREHVGFKQQVSQLPDQIQIIVRMNLSRLSTVLIAFGV